MPESDSSVSLYGGNTPGKICRGTGPPAKQRKQGFDVLSSDISERPRLFKERQEAEQRAVEEARKQAAARAEAQGAADLTAVAIPNVALEDMTVEQLQAVILAKMAKNGPVNDQMHRDVEANIWHDSLVNWAKSFR